VLPTAELCARLKAEYRQAAEQFASAKDFG